MAHVRTLLGGLLAVALVFAMHATTQALVFVDMDFDQGNVAPGGTVFTLSNSGLVGTLDRDAHVADGRLQLPGTLYSVMYINWSDTFGETPFDGQRPFTIEMDFQASTPGLLFAADSTNFIEGRNERGAFSFYVNDELTRDNWWVNRSGAGPSLVDDLPHHVKIDYAPDLDADTATFTFTIDGEVFSDPPTAERPSDVTHDTRFESVILGGALDFGLQTEIGFFNGWIDNLLISAGEPPPGQGIYVYKGALVFDTTANSITLNGEDLNTPGVHFSLGDETEREELLGPGTYQGSGSTTYTWSVADLAEEGDALHFVLISDVTKVGTNDIAFVVPGDMQVGADLSGLGPISLDVVLLQMNGGGVLDASGGAIAADTVDVRGGGSLTLSSGNVTDLLVGGTLSINGATSVNQLSLNGGTVNDAGGGSLTSANVSVTSGDMAFELGGGAVNVPLTGGGSVHVTGDVILGAANTYTGPTRISTGGSLQTTNPTGVDSSTNLELDGGSLVVNSALVEPTLGVDVEFLISDDRNTPAGGGWAATAQDTVLTINDGETLKYASTLNWLGVSVGAEPTDGFGRSVLGLNNSSLATHTIELTNDLDLNSVAGNNNTRAFGVAAGQTAIFSGDILDTGPSANGDVADQAIFAVGGGGTLVLTGDGSSGGFAGTFAGGGVLFTSDDYFAPSVNWNFDGTFPIPGPANDFTTDGVTDLGGTTQHASTLRLGGSGGINNGTLRASGTIHVETGVTVGVNLVGASTMQISQGTVTLNGSNSAANGIILGGFDVDSGDNRGAFVRLGHNNALGPAGSTVVISPAASNDIAPGELEVGLTVADGSTDVDIQANIAMGDQVLTLEATGGGVLTISGTISGNTIDVVDVDTLLPIATVLVPGGGGGKVVFNGNNTYGGGTSIIQNGILEVNGTSASPIHDIRDNGTLQGAGTLNSVIVGENATFRPGISATGNMTATSVVWELGSTYSTMAIERRTAGLGTAGGEPTGNYTVQFTDESEGAPANVAEAGEHVGFGNFIVSMDSSSPTLGATLFQAISGDVNGDREVNSIDIQLILAANSFGNGTGFDWTEGDNNGDGEVGADDIQNILATNLFEVPGPYAANPTESGTPAGGVADLVIHADGTATLEPNGLVLNGFILKSLGGKFNETTVLPNAFFASNEADEASAGFLFGDIVAPIDLGQLFDPSALPILDTDLDFTYTVAGAGGSFDGNCIGCIPEPSSLVLAAIAIAGLVAYGRRRI